MSAFDLPIGWGGLHNTVGGAATPEGFWRRSWNATAERGALGARPGIWDVWTPSLSTCWGAGYGQWSGLRALVQAVQTPADPANRASLVLLDADTWAPLAPPAESSGTLSASRWTWVQYDQAMLGLNAADGIWRWTIARTGSTWSRVPMRWQVATRDPVRRVAAGPAPAALSWTAGRTALASEWPSAGKGATAATISVPDDTLTFTIAPQTGSTSRETLLRFGVDFGAAADCRASRYLGFRLSVAISETEPRPHENYRYEESNAYGRLRAYASTDATAPPGDLADSRWREVGAFAVARSAEGSATQGTAAVDVVVDLDRGQRRAASGAHDSASWLQTVRRVMVVVPGRTGNTQVVTVGPIARGGVFLSKPDFESPMTLTPFTDYGANLRDVDYVVQYCATGAASGAGGGFQQHRLPSTEAAGQPLADGAARMGASAIVSWAAGTGPYAPASMPRVRVWRRRWSDGGKWYLMLDAANAAGTYTDTAVDDARDAVAWPTGTTLPASHEWDFTQGQLEDASAGEIRPTCAAAWKTHLVVGDGRWVYLSQANNPGVFAPRPDDPTRQVNIDDDTGPRTVVMSADRSDVVVAIAAADALYLVGERSTSVMVGDTARSATPPRTLPNSRGTPSVQGACVHDGGVLVCAEDGLWWYRADLSSVEGADTVYQSVELTAGVRESWDDLWYSDLARPIVVQSHEGELWVVRGTRYLRRTRDGAWEEGAWNESALEFGRRAGASGDPLYPEPGTALPPGPGDGGATGGWEPDAGDGQYVAPPPPTCDDAPGNWSVALTVNARWTDSNGNSGPLTATTGGKGLFGIGSLTVEGYALAVATWIGAGDPPDVCPLTIFGSVNSTAGGGSGTYSADNGLGDVLVNQPAGVLASGTHVVPGPVRIVRFRGTASGPMLSDPSVTYSFTAGIASGQCALVT